MPASHDVHWESRAHGALEVEARGMGARLIATHRLGLSHSTVKHHPANTRSSVGAETTAQLSWILAPRLPETGGESQTDP
jgi:hypothetical protein